MRKISLFLFFTFFTAFSQIDENNSTYKFYLSKAKENTVENLMKYKGTHTTKSVDEYKFTDSDWQLIKTDTTTSEVNYCNFYLTFKRSHFEKPLIRYLAFEGYNDKDNYYVYSSYYGTVCIYGGFKTVILYDKPDENKKPTKKYIFNF
ncbi:hypothetical protein [uncultured Flavobacterium sp.]|uniref:hypothetical protein n=1 Tax=uncultured Flavobacterium sp. TaxID=165435 RepID=UPI0025D80274|nr:hypothetical protein [uncultured Flavobacterium sp.]